MYRNSEGYLDKTAEEAIRAADRPPEDVAAVIRLMKQAASIAGLEVTNRIWLRDRKTGREWR